ncbi:hypothetical protein C8J56DRAFT_860606 [Mycena floridula]|nr:hypothetical protein C8J56DRAFT_860606 [Mycena floridula]
MVSSAFENEYCTPPSNPSTVESGTLRTAVVQEGLKWNVGEAITIKFLNGEYEPIGFREKVKKYAEEWIVPGVTANLSYIWVPDGGNNADVRILYDTEGNGNSWSAIGTSCRGNTDQTQPTMSLGWKWGETDDEQARHIRHEFGHMLGFEHEHQNPNANIPWDMDAVYAYYKDKGRDKDWVNKNFKALNDPDVVSTDYDTSSIMHYQIKEEWVTNKAYKVDSPPLVLSPKDKRLAYRSYPPFS